MRLLWLCNNAPGDVQEKIKASKSSGFWLDHVLQSLRKQDLTIRVLCREQGEAGQLDDRCSYGCYQEPVPYVYYPELEQQFLAELETFRPDVIHIWGTEYGHTLAMVNAAEKAGLLDRTVISIQGLCTEVARHYAKGVPTRIQNGYTFRDLLRRDNMAQQAEKFAKRGELEVAAIQKARHVIGRTHWDKACAMDYHPEIQYHFCNETLREEFYEGAWQYESCRQHRIFASSCSYPVKGFHYLLEAFAQVLKDYPDARLAVTGKSFLGATGLKQKLRRNGYDKYLTDLVKKHHLEDKIDFLGKLDAKGMKQAFLDANVFALPSTIENSPNSLGEAMLLGVPCVAAEVGGVSDLMTGTEGRVYPPGDTAMLAAHIREVFAMGESASQMGRRASAHARNTHDPQINMETLMQVYQSLM